MNLKPYECLHCKTRDCSILSGCNTESLQYLSNYKSNGALAKGENLFNKGSEISGVYFIKKGIVKIQNDSVKGKPIIIRLAGKGAILGNRITISKKQKVHTYTAVAVSDIEYCYVTYSIFQQLIKKSPILKQKMLEEFVEDLNDTESRIVKLAHNSVRENLADILLMLAGIYDYDVSAQSFEICFYRQDLADLIGTTKEQVSKNLKDFEKEGIIKCTAKRFHYLDLETLREISGSATGVI